LVKQEHRWTLIKLQERLKQHKMLVLLYGTDINLSSSQRGYMTSLAYVAALHVNILILKNER